MHLSDWLTATNKCFPHLGLAPGAPEGAADQSEAERGEPRSIDLVGPVCPALPPPCAVVPRVPIEENRDRGASSLAHLAKTGA